MANVFRKHEISLFGNYYTIIGAVEQQNVGQLIERQIFGDVSKDSEKIASTWNTSDQRGGIGVKHMDEKEDTDRVWWSTCELGHKGHLLLSPLVTAVANPATSTPDPVQMIEYNNAQYTAFGTGIYKFAETSTAFGSSLHTLQAAPTDVIVHKNKLYWACDTDFTRFDGSTWTNGNTLSAVQPCRYFTEWDEKLFTLDNDGQLDYSVDEGVTWVTNAKSNLPSGSFTSLFTYRDTAGNMIIYMGTKVGLFALNFDNAQWLETELTMPFHDFACIGANKWFDAAYIPNGGALIQYRTSNPAMASPIGPDLDDGLPGAYRGNIIKVIPGHNEFFILLDATSTETQTIFPAAYPTVYGNVQIMDSTGFSAILKHDRRGWKPVHVSGSAAEPAKCAMIGSPDGKYRLWFGMDNKAHFMDLQHTVQNPSELSDYEYSLSGENQSPWFDADLATADKLAARVLYHATGLSSTEYIKLYYGTDYDDDTWTLLTNSTFSDGQIDTTGTAEFTFASSVGVTFKAIRFKEELYRSSSNTKVSPNRRWMRLSYRKILTPRWGFQISVDCRKNYRFRTARAMLTQLKTDQESKTLGLFQFKDGTDTENHYVTIDPMKSIEVGAGKSRGVVSLHLVAP